jgi:hypothetical protein
MARPTISSDAVLIRLCNRLVVNHALEEARIRRTPIMTTNGRSPLARSTMNAQGSALQSRGSAHPGRCPRRGVGSNGPAPARQQGRIFVRGLALLASDGVRRVSGQPAIAVTVDADAALLALCAEFHKQDAVAGTVQGDEALNAAMEVRCSLSARIKSIAPTTRDGLRAKAVVGLHLLEENGSSDPEEDADIAFAYAVLRYIATVLRDLAAVPV